MKWTNYFFEKELAIKILYATWIILILTFFWGTMPYLDWISGSLKPFEWLRQLCLFLFYRSGSVTLN